MTGFSSFVKHSWKWSAAERPDFELVQLASPPESNEFPFRFVEGYCPVGMLQIYFVLVVVQLNRLYHGWETFYLEMLVAEMLVD